MAKSESTEDRKKRARQIVSRLVKAYDEADCALIHEDAFQLLVATILSAQSTDETVNRIAPQLFSRYPDVEALAAAKTADVEKIIKPTGFFRQKTKSIINASRTIVEEFDGEVPDTMESLVKLPGVARKTANVVLGTWYKQNEGVVVDTHVGRLAHRLGLTWTSKDAKDAIKIEKDLMQVLPKQKWTFVSHALILHGRRVCSARKPDCPNCVLASLCPSAGQFDSPPKKKAKRAAQ
jgi:endonuclease-3